MVDWELEPDDNAPLKHGHVCVLRRIVDDDTGEAFYRTRTEYYEDSQETFGERSRGLFEKERLEEAWPDESELPEVDMETEPLRVDATERLEELQDAERKER